MNEEYNYGQPENSQQYGDPNNNNQYGNPNNGNQYGNSNNGQQYGNPNAPYGTYQAPGKGNGTGLGIASMVLGIVSLLLFVTCINYILGIIAIVLGIIQIVKNEKKGMAIAGIVTAAISMLLTIVVWLGIVSAVGTFGPKYFEENYESFIEQYQDELDNDF